MSKRAKKGEQASERGRASQRAPARASAPEKGREQAHERERHTHTERRECVRVREKAGRGEMKIHICDMTDSCVGHDSFVCGK